MEKNQPYISELDWSTDLADFTTQMTEKDTIKIVANLTMENWIRQDHLIFSKKDNEIQLKTKCEETNFDFKKTDRWISDFKVIGLENEGKEFEKYFLDRIERTTTKDGHSWIYKLINGKDTLTFYSKGLSDKGSELEKYYSLMQKFYPDEREFKLIEVIKE